MHRLLLYFLQLNLLSISNAFAWSNLYNDDNLTSAARKDACKYINMFIGLFLVGNTDAFS